MKFVQACLLSGLSLVSLSLTQAQSLRDAKIAIDAEQYEKAKSFLESLTQTQANKDENFFYLGLVYGKTDHWDLAKSTFSKGIAIHPKSALNHVGLGMVDRIHGDEVNAQRNLDKATTLAPKDPEVYEYLGRVYLLTDQPQLDQAIRVLEKGLGIYPKYAPLHAALGDAYRVQLKNSEAYRSYTRALDLDANLLRVMVTMGLIWKQANNFEASEKEYRRALAINPDYGPAYRELAETYVRWAAQKPSAEHKAYVQQAVEYYKKYLSLTDESLDSRMRYADFLMQAGDYQGLEQEANAIAQMAQPNLRVYRYIAYAACENGHFQQGLEALNKFLKEASPNRIIPRDYVYLGRLQLQVGEEESAMESLNEGLSLASNNANNTAVHAEIAQLFYEKKNYMKAAAAYEQYIRQAKKVKLKDYAALGRSYYFAYNDQYLAADKDSLIRPDRGLLDKADSAFTYVISRTVANSVPMMLTYKARVQDLKEPDRAQVQGLAKESYEQLIRVISAKVTPLEELDKKYLTEAYAYLGAYYAFTEKDVEKATESFRKVQVYDPSNKQAAAFFARKKPNNQINKK